MNGDNIQTRSAKMRTMRAKLKVVKVAQTSYNQDGSISQEELTFNAVTGPDGSANREWSKWTPSGNFQLTVSNPELFGKIRAGQEYYVDFTLAEQEGEQKSA